MSSKTYSNGDQFLDEVSAYFDSTLWRFKSIFKASAKEAGKRLVDATPIWFEHETRKAGNTRANWKVSLDSPDLTYNKGDVDPSGRSTQQQLSRVIQTFKVKDNSVIYFCNSSPSVWALELGKYPTQNPGGEVKRGSWNSMLKKYEKRSSGGYSIQQKSYFGGKAWGMVEGVSNQWMDITLEAISDAIAAKVEATAALASK